MDNKGKVWFVGAGSGAPDLITVRGQRLLREADMIVYAGSLVNPALLENAKPGCEIHDSARLHLDPSGARRAARSKVAYGRSEHIRRYTRADGQA